jgi:hypothetical protein
MTVLRERKGCLKRLGFLGTFFEKAYHEQCSGQADFLRQEISRLPDSKNLIDVLNVFELLIKENCLDLSDVVTEFVRITRPDIGQIDPKASLYGYRLFREGLNAESTASESEKAAAFEGSLVSSVKLMQLAPDVDPANILLVARTLRNPMTDTKPI